jgi:hypothetical protein
MSGSKKLSREFLEAAVGFGSAEYAKTAYVVGSAGGPIAGLSHDAATATRLKVTKN